MKVLFQLAWCLTPNRCTGTHDLSVYTLSKASQRCIWFWRRCSCDRIVDGCARDVRSSERDADMRRLSMFFSHSVSPVAQAGAIYHW